MILGLRILWMPPNGEIENMTLTKHTRMKNEPYKEIGNFVMDYVTCVSNLLIVLVLVVTHFQDKLLE